MKKIPDEITRLAEIIYEDQSVVYAMPIDKNIEVPRIAQIIHKFFQDNKIYEQIGIHE